MGKWQYIASDGEKLYVDGEPRPLPPIVSAKKYSLWTRLFYWLTGRQLPVVIMWESRMKPHPRFITEDEEYVIEFYQSQGE